MPTPARLRREAARRRTRPRPGVQDVGGGCRRRTRRRRCPCVVPVVDEAHRRRRRGEAGNDVRLGASRAILRVCGRRHQPDRSTQAAPHRDRRECRTLRPGLRERWQARHGRRSRPVRSHRVARCDRRPDHRLNPQPTCCGER